MKKKNILLPAKFRTRPFLALAGVVAVSLLAGGTVRAANGSKPGDILYAVDTTTEKVRSILAFDPKNKANLAVDLANERVSEVQAITMEQEIKPADLNAALDGLAAQRAAVADLVIREADLKRLAKTYEDALDKEEAGLDAVFTEANRLLDAREKELKTELQQAEASNNNLEAGRIREALAALEAQAAILEAEEEAAEKALEAEEERLEAQLEAAEKTLEAEEEAREAEIERLEAEAEAAREKAEEAREADRGGLEQAAERAEEAEDKARDDNLREIEAEEAENPEVEDSGRR